MNFVSNVALRTRTTDTLSCAFTGRLERTYDIRVGRVIDGLRDRQPNHGFLSISSRSYRDIVR